MLDCVACKEKRKKLTYIILHTFAWFDMILKIVQFF